MLLIVASILLLLGLVFLAAETILPLHGTSLIGGLATVAIAVAIFFSRSVWAGLGALTGSLLGVPILAFWMIRVWPYTPVGRRVILAPPAADKPAPSISIGMEGVVITELRPAGMCEFSGVRIAATSEEGFVEPGKTVRVVGMNGKWPRVRCC